MFTQGNASKYALLVSFLAASLVAQLNLKVTAPRLPTSLSALQALGFGGSAILLVRAALFSGASLALSWLCLKKFGYFEFVVFTALTYPTAALASRFLLGEPFRWFHLVSTLFIILGVLFYRFDAIVG